jgi:hypothetical protein
VKVQDAPRNAPRVPHGRDDGSPVSPLYSQKDSGEFSRQILARKITPNYVWNQPSALIGEEFDGVVLPFVYNSRYKSYWRVVTI